METEGVRILSGRNHIREVRAGPYLLDGFDTLTKTAYEYHGCYFHSCSPCKKEKTDIGQERKQHTEIKEKFLKENGYHLRVIWEHEFKESLRKDPNFKQFV